jgi:hypothetical protein
MHLSRSLPLLAVAALAACSGSSGGTGTLSVKLVDGPADVKELWLDIQRVDLNGPDGWQTLSTPKQIVDVMSLQHGFAASLANETIPAGHYGQMRLVLGPGNAVVLQDGSRHDLKVPSGMQSGVKLAGDFDVAPGTTRDIYIDLDAHRSVFVHEAGASAQWILRPVIRTFDKLETGSISGTLTDSASHPLVDVDVMAETVDGSGVATVVRTVTTDANGHYVLDLLPVGGSYYVVSAPVVAGATPAYYAPKASDAIPVTAAIPTPVWNPPPFTQMTASELGGIAGGITPVASTVTSDADLVAARIAFTAGGPALVVREVAGVVSSGVETYAIPGLALGTYAITAARRSDDGSGGEIVKAGTPSVPSVAVTAGATVTVDVSFPP